MKNVLLWVLLLPLLPGLVACQKESLQLLESPIDLSPPPEPDRSWEIVCYTPEMPYLQVCAGIENRQERKNCSDEKIREIIYSNLRYPTDDCVEGIIVITFRVNADGSKEQFKIARGIHPLFDKEALRVVKLLPGFMPGRQFGKVVPVQFNIPVRFKLY